MSRHHPPPPWLGRYHRHHHLHSMYSCSSRKRRGLPMALLGLSFMLTFYSPMLSNPIQFWSNPNKSYLQQAKMAVWVCTMLPLSFMPSLL
jgi:hypothetical protein